MEPHSPVQLATPTAPEPSVVVPAVQLTQALALRYWPWGHERHSTAVDPGVQTVVGGREDNGDHTNGKRCEWAKALQFAVVNYKIALSRAASLHRVSTHLRPMQAAFVGACWSAHSPEQLPADAAPAAAVVLPAGHAVQLGPAGPPALQEPMLHRWQADPPKPGKQTD